MHEKTRTDDMLVTSTTLPSSSSSSN